MKKNLFFVLIIVVLTSCSKYKNTVIEGDLLNSSDINYVYLVKFNLTNERIIDSTYLNKNGEFKFKVKIKDPQLFKLQIGDKNLLWLLASPGEKIKIKADAKNLSVGYSVDGSVYSSQVKTLNDELVKSSIKLDSINKAIILAILKQQPDSTIQRLKNDYLNVIKNYRNFSLTFILNNLNSPASVFALFQQFNDSLYVYYKATDIQYIKLVADSLSKYYPEADLVKAICTQRNSLISEYNNIIKQHILLNKQKEVRLFPEIQLSDIEGDSIKLSSVNAKLILVCFWVPGDKDCMVALNTFSKMYWKYHSKGFELFNVALIDDFGYWVSIIKKTNLPGINVIDQYASSSVTAKIYNVRQLPATYLIKPDKGVVGSYLYGDELETIIKKELK